MAFSAFLDVLLRRATVIIERHHPLGRARRHCQTKWAGPEEPSIEDF